MGVESSVNMSHKSVGVVLTGWCCHSLLSEASRGPFHLGAMFTTLQCNALIVVITVHCICLLISNLLPSWLCHAISGYLFHWKSLVF